MKNIKVVIINTIFIIFSFACNEQTINTDKIDQDIELRLYIDKQKKIQQCRINAIMDAEIYVDSVITHYTIESLGLDTTFPKKPLRDTSADQYNIVIDSVNLNKIRDSIFTIDK